MDDNNLPTPPQNLPTGDQDNAADKEEALGEDIQGNEKVFDISPDLNISPVEDAATDQPLVPLDANKLGINQLVQPARPIPNQENETAKLRQVEQKEPLFSFKGHDIRSGKKEEIPAKPFTQSSQQSSLQDAVGIQTPKPKPFVTPQPNPIPIQKPPIKPAPTNPIPLVKVPPTIRTISTAPAPTMPNRVGSETPKPLRTYEGDVAEVLAHKGTSAASIAIAENRKASGQDQIGEVIKAPHSSSKKLILIIVSLILIFGGVIGAYYLYSISALAPVERASPQPETAPALVNSDSKMVIPIDGMSTVNIINAVRMEMAKPQSPNTLKEIILAQTKNGERFRITSANMVSIMDISAPDVLQRALNTDWMLGVYADGNGAKTLFVLATIDYFQNAFAGMLQWEAVMADDLKQYLYQNTPIPTPYVVLSGSFIDRIIKNKDVREFVTSNGNVLFLYSFIDNTKLVIAGSEATLTAILDRLEQQTFVR